MRSKHMNQLAVIALLNTTQFIQPRGSPVFINSDKDEQSLQIRSNGQFRSAFTGAVAGRVIVNFVETLIQKPKYRPSPVDPYPEEEYPEFEDSPEFEEKESILKEVSETKEYDVKLAEDYMSNKYKSLPTENPGKETNSTALPKGADPVEKIPNILKARSRGGEEMKKHFSRSTDAVNEPPPAPRATKVFKSSLGAVGEAALGSAIFNFVTGIFNGKTEKSARKKEREQEEREEREEREEEGVQEEIYDEDDDAYADDFVDDTSSTYEAGLEIRAVNS